MYVFESFQKCKTWSIYAKNKQKQNKTDITHRRIGLKHILRKNTNNSSYSGHGHELLLLFKWFLFIWFLLDFYDFILFIYVYKQRYLKEPLSPLLGAVPQFWDNVLWDFTLKIWDWKSNLKLENKTVNMKYVKK